MLLQDLKILNHLLFPKGQTGSTAERLNQFYAPQADAYDAFRERLLPGRAQLLRDIPWVSGSSWGDFGCGTGKSLEFAKQHLRAQQQIHLVDLSQALLNKAELRVHQMGLSQVTITKTDICSFHTPQALTTATCCYSLSMVDHWFAAIDNIHAQLAPGGHIGVVDFYVSRKYPQLGQRKHSWWTRTFWPVWFAHDNIHLGPDQLDYLQHKFETISLIEQTTRIPYLPFARVPYFRFIGRKK